MNRFIFWTFLLLAPALNAQQCPDSCNFYIPTTLTPDCDDVDCTLLQPVMDCPVSKYSFTVYSRWGTEVFQTKNPDEAYDTKELEQGIYYWKLTGKWCNGQKLDANGHVNILK